ncbi:hypothetical protein SX4_1464 [Vibrio mimicus SX-4]|nr:hypothetical protein SX4_1464 [Vibrio mimicus SX-4]
MIFHIALVYPQSIKKSGIFAALGIDSIACLEAVDDAF